MPLETIDEVVILLLEGGPICQVTSSQTDSQSLAGIGWTDTHSGSADCCVATRFLEFLLLGAISLFLNLGNEMCTSRDFQTALVVYAVVIKLR